MSGPQILVYKHTTFLALSTYSTLKKRQEKKKEVNMAVRNLKSLKHLKFGGNHPGLTDMQWS